ncbi:Thaumatin-like protein 1 [Ananas comosus]|uniref:Thaumatin-like protein 1 n=1 Tax=Ananas comosus TaxID=4615 RepID=A0A199UFU3_ANACO|nr:Thaumatin-like protein 1 [Ananas comosus]
MFESAGALSATFTVTNSCGYTVWPGVLSSAGTAALGTTGFVLSPGESRNLDVPASWSGRLWGRTLCSTDPATGAFSCATGDCGSAKTECSGGGAAPPATLAEFTLNGSGGMDFYDVSLVDGYRIANFNFVVYRYNLPMLVVPHGGTGGNCTATGCLVDINSACPSDLKVVVAASVGGSGGVACKSACEAFGSPQYCCSGAYGNPNTCRPSTYSQFFKNSCPRAYSYAYDDATSTFTCASADYIITFCPGTASQKSSGKNPEAAGLPAAAGLPMVSSDGMVFLSGEQISKASPPVMLRISILPLALAVVLLVSLLQLLLLSF